MELVVLDKTGKDTGRKVTLNDEIFGITPSNHAVYLEVKQYLAAQRQGTHKSKEKGEITGSTRKLHKQKGTGGSRKGSIKNPLFKGGGRIFGPAPRDYRFKLNRSLKKLAKKSVLSQKLADNQLKIVEDFNFEAPKTQDFTQILKDLGVDNKKSLFVLGDSNKNVYLSSRNLKQAKVITASELNSYDLMNASELFLFEGGLEKLQKNLSK